jgi:FMN reductase
MGDQPVVIVAASPSRTSRSSAIARDLAQRLEAAGHRTRWYSVHDFEPADVLHGRADAPAMREFLSFVERAPALVLTTPVYKASYAGALKALVDLIPPEALVGRPVLGMGTTRIAPHGSQLERAYTALFAFFRASPVGPVVVLDAELRVTDDGRVALDDGAGERVAIAAAALSRAIRGVDLARASG